MDARPEPARVGGAGRVPLARRRRPDARRPVGDGELAPALRRPRSMRLGRAASASTAGLAGFVVGAVLTLSLQGTGLPRHGRPGQIREAVPVTRPEAPRTFLAWTPGGLPSGFRRRVAELRGMERTGGGATRHT